MKLFALLLSLFLSLSVAAQTPDAVLAKANGQAFTAQDLAPEARGELANLPAMLRNARKNLLEQQIADILFEKEAVAKKITVQELLETEIGDKIPAPTDKDVQAVYDANRTRIGEQSLEQVKAQIVEFLRRDARQKAYAALVADLKSKYKTAFGKEVNAANLNRLEILATVGDRQISVGSFESKNKIALAEIEADVYDEARASLEQVVLSNLIAVEAKAQNKDASDYIAAEITNKIKEYTDAERLALETDLRTRLFKKYDAAFSIKQIPTTVQTVATENQPARGRAGAPVTVVMFSDFQCSACAGAYPVLQEVLKTYGEKARFVVRDFPLPTLHENAYRAALAANAAHAQGKFFEYTEILYANQSKLDEASLIAYAAQIGANVKQFEADLKSRRYAPDVEKDIADGKTLGINGTPTIYVNGVKVRQLTPESFRRAIDAALKK